ncbi:MAG: transporter substrate-binding domain-containing protein [Cyclobacteriaceae bacterium]
MRKPNNLPLYFLYLFSALNAFSCFAQYTGTSFENARRTKEATFVYIYDEVYGFTAKNETGLVSGVLVDMMQEFEAFVRAKEGIQITSEFIDERDFDLFLKNVRTGNGAVFGLSNISINEERKKIYSFSPPYLENVSVLVSNAGAPMLGSMDDIAVLFEGMTAYTLSSSTYQQRLLEIKSMHFADMQIIEMAKMDPIMTQLRTNSKAFAVLDLNVYLEALQKKWPIKRHAIGDKKGDQFGIIMPKNCDWEPLLAEFLGEFYGSTAYGQIISKNLGGSALKLINSLNR